MNKKDKQLFEQLVSEIKFITSKEELLLKYEKDHEKLSGMEAKPGSILARKREAGFGSLPLSYSSIHALMDMGLIEAYRKDNMKVLHEALFSYSRLYFAFCSVLGNRKNDYEEYVICRNIIESFAACDIEAVKRYCPINSPVLTKGYKMWLVGYNIILGLLYQDEKRIGKGIAQAEKALETKLPKFDAAAIAYLLALAKQDAEQANEQFSVMMSVYRKSSGLFEFRDPFLKVFALLPHGLYNMAYHFLPAESFSKIVPPNDTAFWNELVEYQKTLNFMHGEPYINFSGKLASLSSIYNN